MAASGNGERRVRPAGVLLFARAVEEWIAIASLLLLALLPIVQIVVRETAQVGIPGYNGYLFHLVLLAAFAGGMVTAREGRHLAIRIGLQRFPPRVAKAISVAEAMLSSAVTTAFAWASLSFVLIGFEPGATVGIVPVRLFGLIMPVGFLVMAVRFFLAAPRGASRAFAAAGFVAGTWLAYVAIEQLAFFFIADIPLWVDAIHNAWYVAIPFVAPVLIVLLVAATFVGVPLFVVLGGAALLLFARSGGAIEVVANEGYVLLTGNAIPAIPLFTLAGFLLSESKAGERLVRLFRALFAWLPGGLVIAAVLVSTFFTTFTGASGVTILALGGLLLYVLVESGRHDERFSTGLLTAIGSIGLLFPPSLAIIIYGSIAQISIFDLFLGGLIPGALMVLAMCAIGVVVAVRRKIPSVPFEPREAIASVRESIWELLLPVIIVVVYFTGLATLVETAAVSVLYALAVEVFVRREIALRQLPKVIIKAVTIVGGVLVILALARALSYYIIDVEIPSRLSDWVARTIESRFVFLLLVNVALLVTGCFMDIFSAILVVAPLIIPLGELYGINPIHLGVIFIANMGIGFITPPVGMNLFLASYRFDTPLPKLYRTVLPFFLVQLAIVLVITYVPALSTLFTRLL